MHLVLIILVLATGEAIALWCTILLTITAIIGVIVAVRTLITLKEQTEATRIAADAAKQNIDLLIRKERARIFIEPYDFNFDTSDEYRPVHELKYKVICSGTTPAIIYDSHVTAEVNASRERAGLEQWRQIPLPGNFEPNVIEMRVPLLGESNCRGVFLDEQIEEGKLFVNFWGYINYRDIFFEGDGFWRKSFRYIWDAQGERFIKCGEPWENAESRKTPPKNPN